MFELIFGLSIVLAIINIVNAARATGEKVELAKRQYILNEIAIIMLALIALSRHLV